MATIRFKEGRPHSYGIISRRAQRNRWAVADSVEYFGGHQGAIEECRVRPGGRGHDERFWLDGSVWRARERSVLLYR